MAVIQQENKTYKNVIIAISVFIPIAVAVLIYMPFKLDFFGSWVKQLPGLNAIINSLTALLLILAVISIKFKNVGLHKLLMTIAFAFGAVFLISYIIYHASVDSVMFGDINGDKILSEEELSDVGSTRGIYLFVLLSHILFSIIVVPFVLMAFYFAFTNKLDSHRKIVKFTFPIWLYVSVTGVITYIMISPYYL